MLGVLRLGVVRIGVFLLVEVSLREGILCVLSLADERCR